MADVVSMVTAINPAEKSLNGVIERLLFASASGRTFVLSAEFIRSTLVITDLAGFISARPSLQTPNRTFVMTCGAVSTPRARQIAEM
jgi:hypothetical protein